MPKPAPLRKICKRWARQYALPSRDALRQNFHLFRRKQESLLHAFVMSFTQSGESPQRIPGLVSPIFGSLEATRLTTVGC